MKGSSSSSCSTLRAEAIGATTVGWASSQASATAETLAPCAAATASSASSTAKPRSSMKRLTPWARGLSTATPSRRYLPVKKPDAERVVGDGRDPRPLGHIARTVLVVATQQVVLVLQRDDRWKALALDHLECELEALASEVRKSDIAHAAGGDELAEGAERLLERRLRVVVVDVVEVDVVAAQASQRRLGAGEDGFAGETRVRRDLRRDDDAPAVAARGHPVADDRLRFTARVARHPGRVAGGRVDEVAARGGVGVENFEGGRLIGGPAEHVAAQAEREDLDAESFRAAASLHPNERRRLRRWRPCATRFAACATPSSTARSAADCSPIRSWSPDRAPAHERASRARAAAASRSRSGVSPRWSPDARRRRRRATSRGQPPALRAPGRVLRAVSRATAEVLGGLLAAPGLRPRRARRRRCSR